MITENTLDCEAAFQEFLRRTGFEMDTMVEFDLSSERRFVQPDPATGYRFTVLDDGTSVYHRIDLSDLAEPFLSRVERALADGEREHCKVIAEIRRLGCGH